MNVQELYQLWLEQVQDEELHAQLEQMDEKEVYEAFYTELEFGTGGIRGVMGPGTNRMNRYIVARATAGMAAIEDPTYQALMDRVVESGMVVVASAGKNTSYIYGIKIK